MLNNTNVIRRAQGLDYGEDYCCSHSRDCLLQLTLPASQKGQGSNNTSIYQRDINGVYYACWLPLPPTQRALIYTSTLGSKPMLPKK